MDEIVDFVDEKDEVIGEVRRSEAKKNPDIIHREVAIIVVDNKNRVLFQKRSRDKSVHPLYWTVSVAGWLGKGEDIEEAAHRELKEELGFDTGLKFFAKIFARHEDQSQFHYIYVGNYDGEEIKIQKEELEEVEWWSKEEFLHKEASREKIGPSSKIMVRKFWEIE